MGTNHNFNISTFPLKVMHHHVICIHLITYVCNPRAFVEIWQGYQQLDPWN